MNCLVGQVLTLLIFAKPLVPLMPTPSSPKWSMTEWKQTVTPTLTPRLESWRGNLAGKVLDRRLFKRPVMTSVYGVTPFGLRRSLMRDLHQLRVVNTSSEAEAAAGYLSQLFVGCFRDGLFSKVRMLSLLMCPLIYITCHAD